MVEKKLHGVIIKELLDFRYQKKDLRGNLWKSSTISQRIFPQQIFANSTFLDFDYKAFKFGVNK